LQEISRPLSLPPENWRIGLGTGIQLSREYTNFYSIQIDPYFSYPYFQLGDRWEYYVPSIFKFYLLKDVEIRDSVMYLRGLNAAIVFGITGIYWSEADGFGMTLSGRLQYKQPITSSVYSFSNTELDYATNTRNLSGQFSIGLGSQITAGLYTTLGLSVSYYNYYYPGQTRYTFFSNGRYHSFYGSLPLVLGWNLTQKWSIYWKNQISYYGVFDARFGSLIGFSFTW
jgi:hypothetical protein